MKTEKNLKIILFFLIFILIGMIPIITFAALEDTITVSTQEEFVEAVKNTNKNIKLTADIDLSNKGVLDVSGRIIDLGGNKISASNFTLIFEGTDVTIKNGTFDSKGGSYALFIGDEGTTNNFVVENITTKGGINIYNATNVIIKDTSVSVAANANAYYAVWCDEGGQVIIKSGEFSSKGKNVLGLVSKEKGSSLKIEGGTFITNGIGLVLKGDNYGSPEISGGSFDVSVDETYCAEEFEPVKLSDGTYSVCNHSNTVIKNKKVANCTNEGYTGDTYCAKCNKFMKTGEVIAKNKENHIDNNKDGKCDNCGYERENIGLVDNKTNIRLTGVSYGVLPENVILKIEDNIDYNKVKKALPNIENLVAFDIDLLLNGVKIQPNGQVEIKIPIPNQFNTSNLAVYRVEDGKAIEYKVRVDTIDSIKYAIFKTDHFSTYVLVDNSTETDDGKDDTPKTGVTGSSLFALPITFISALGIFIVKKKTK